MGIRRSRLFCLTLPYNSPPPRRVSPACGVLDNSVLRGFIIYPPPKRSHSSHYPLLCGQVAYGPNAQRTECRSSAAVRTSPRLILSHRRALHANSRRWNIPNLPCAWAPGRGLSDTAWKRDIDSAPDAWWRTNGLLVLMRSCPLLCSYMRRASSIRTKHVKDCVTIILVTLVVNSGQLILEFVQHVRRLNATIRIVL